MLYVHFESVLQITNLACQLTFQKPFEGGKLKKMWWEEARITQQHECLRSTSAPSNSIIQLKKNQFMLTCVSLQ